MGTERRMRALAFLCLLGLACGALAFDCDTLHEPERTRCLDRAADQNVEMMPVADDVAKPLPQHSFIEDDDDTDDIMGDLGEAASSGAEAKVQVQTTAKAQAHQQLKMAAAASEGMYDSDVQVMRAFSDLTDSMSDLDTHVRFLQTKNKVEAAESNARQEYDREHEAQERELGESDSVEGHHESLGVLDASASDLSDALTVHYHADIVPDTDKKVDDLLGKMSASLKEKESPLDSAGDFIETGETQSFGDDELGTGMTDDLVLQDVGSSSKSLVERAQLEAGQTNAMGDEDDLKAEADELGDAQEAGSKVGAGLDVVSATLVEHPELGKDESAETEIEAREAQDVVHMDESDQNDVGDIGAISQSNDEQGATAFASAEDKKEEEMIQAEQAREKKMEESAKEMMYSDMRDMKDLQDSESGLKRAADSVD